METQQRNSVKEFLETATAKEVSEFVGLLEKNTCLVEAHNNFIRLVKMAAFVKMETELEIHRHTWKGKNSKRYPTELLLHSKSKEVTLFISSKDAHDLDSMYARLYDEQKDKLLQWIDERQSTDQPAGYIAAIEHKPVVTSGITREKVMELAREYSGTDEERATVVDLIMLMPQFSADVVEGGITQIKDMAAPAGEGTIKKTIDVELVLLELAADMTVEELGEWKESVNVISKEKGYDPQGKMALMFKEVIDTTIKGK